MSLKFNTKIVQIGNNTGINVPPEIIEKLAAGKKPPVLVTLNNYSYRSTVAVMGGKFMISLSADNRTKAKVKGGDELEIEISLDTEPRLVDLPADFQERLNESEDVKTAFEKLSPSRKKAIVVSINEAKTEETRLKRIDKAIESLAAN